MSTMARDSKRRDRRVPRSDTTSSTTDNSMQSYSHPSLVGWRWSGGWKQIRSYLKSKDRRDAASSVTSAETSTKSRSREGPRGWLDLRKLGAYPHHNEISPLESSSRSRSSQISHRGHSNSSDISRAQSRQEQPNTLSLIFTWGRLNEMH